MKKNTLIQPVNILFLSVIFIALATIGSVPGDSVNYSDIYREVIAETGFIGLLLYWIIAHRHAQTITVTLSATRLWLAGLLLFAAASGFWAVDIDFFFSKYLLWLASAAVFLLTLSQSANTKTNIAWSRAIVFVGVYISAIGLIQALLTINIFDQVASPAANLVNKNMASQVVVLIFPLTLFLLLTDKNNHLSALYPFAITLMLAYIFHARTRAAWVSMGMEIIVLVLFWVIYKTKLKQALSEKILHWNREKTTTSIVAFILLLLLLNISADGWTSVVDELIQQSKSIVSTAQNSSNGRYIIWSAALSMLEQRPLLGSGMGSFYYNVLTEIDSFSYNLYATMRAHNDLLELGVELGIIGVILFLGVAICLTINLFKLIRQDDSQQQLFYWAVGAALVGGFVNMQFSFPYQMPVPLMIFGIYSALIIKASDLVSPPIQTITIPLHSKTGTAKESKKWFAGVAFIGIIFIGTLTMNTLWLSSFAQVVDNMKHSRWLDPIDDVPVCSKLITNVLTKLVTLYQNNKEYELSSKVLESFNRCAPDTWVYYHTMSKTLIKLGFQYKAIETIKKAIKIHPKGEYIDYIRLYHIYYKTNNAPKAIEVYQALSTQPESLLAIRKSTFHQLVAMSVYAKNRQQATKFYHLYIKHHGENAQLKKLYMRVAKQDTAES